MKQKIAALLAVLLMGTLFAACASGSAGADRATSTTESHMRAAMEAPAEPQADFRNDSGYTEYELAEEAAYDTDDWDDAAPAAGGGETSLPINVPSIETDNRKIVYTVDLSLQTTEFEEGVRQVPEMVEAIGGFVQDSYVQGTNLGERYYSRSASFTVRVPVEKLTAFTEDLGGIFHIVSQQKSSSDISNNYYDTQARLDSLRIQEERLKAMLETADELQYLLEVERELAQVLYEIESMTSSLRRMDSSVSLSTITIHLQEVTIIDDAAPEPQPVTFGDRVREAFGDSIDGFVSFCQWVIIAAIALLPFLLVLLIAGLVIVLAVRSVRKRHAKRSVRKSPAYPGQGSHPQPPQIGNTPPAQGDPAKPDDTEPPKTSHS